MSFTFGATGAQQKPGFSFGQTQQQPITGSNISTTAAPVFGQPPTTGTGQSMPLGTQQTTTPNTFSATTSSFGNASGGTTALGQSQPPSFSFGASTGSTLSKPDESKKNTFSFGASSTTATTGSTPRLVDIDIYNMIGHILEYLFLLVINDIYFFIYLQLRSQFGGFTTGGFGGITTTTSTPSTNFANANLGFGKSDKNLTTLDTHFRDLEPAHQQEIRSIYSKFNYPMREGLQHLKNKYSDIALDDIHKSLKATSIGTRQIKSKQESLLKQLHSMREIDQSRYQMAERFGNSGLAQIKRMQESHNNYYHSNEILPIELYREVRMQLLNQVEKYSEETKRLIDQIEAVNAQKSNDGSEVTGVYGERVRVGPQHLLQLMQRQSEAFVDVASKVAEIHERTDMAREMYLRMFPDEDDPFVKQDRLESREKQENERRAKENIHKERKKHGTSSSSSGNDQNGSKQSSTDPSKMGFPAISSGPSATVATTSFSFPTSSSGGATAPTTGFQLSGTGGDSAKKKANSKNKSESNLGSFAVTGVSGATPSVGAAGTMPSFNIGGSTGGFGGAPAAGGTTAAGSTGGFGGFGAAPAAGGTTTAASSGGFGGFGAAPAAGGTTAVGSTGGFGAAPAAGAFSFGVKK